jgi:hypothetical protein
MTSGMWRSGQMSVIAPAVQNVSSTRRDAGVQGDGLAGSI